MILKVFLAEFRFKTKEVCLIIYIKTDQYIETFN